MLLLIGGARSSGAPVRFTGMAVADNQRFGATDGHLAGTSCRSEFSITDNPADTDPMLRMILLLMAILAGDAAWAQSDDAANCAAETQLHDLDLAIDDCTEAIQSGQLSDEDLAVALNKRGLAYSVKKEYDQAIRDFDRALSLQPNQGPALIRRADAYLEKRQYERALADYEAAAQIDPKIVSERSQGFLFFYLGRMTQSAEMFEKHMKSDPGDIRIILFRYLAEAKIGNALAAARELELDAAKIQERQWPAPIIDFHIGRIDDKAMFAAASDADPKKRNEKICAATFHAGEARLLRANTSAAIPLLRAAEKDCPSHLYESHAASTELRRLGVK
jgi:lipoprotein NlpI